MKHTNPQFPCSKCKSTNTSLEDQRTYFNKQIKKESLMDKISNKIFAPIKASSMSMPLRGQFAIICKDCGHVDCIIVN